jgi:hypothetical protein
MEWYTESRGPACSGWLAVGAPARRPRSRSTPSNNRWEVRPSPGFLSNRRILVTPCYECTISFVAILASASFMVKIARIVG